MIHLERAYVLMGRAVAQDLLAVSGVNAAGLDLTAIHRLLREHCPSSWHPLLDMLLVVEEADMPELGQRFQDEVACMDPPLRLAPDAGHVVPRSVALWLHPELADRSNECIGRTLRREQGNPLTVVDDEVLIDATIAFNRYLRRHAHFGLSSPAVVH